MSDPLTACSVCRQTLNVRTDQFGEEEFVHSRPWETYDHDPQPVPSAFVEGLEMLCDYCHTPYPTWQHWGSASQRVMGHAATGRWAACDTCDRFVRKGNIDGLLRHVEAQPLIKQQFAEMPALRQLPLRQRHQLTVEYVRSIRRRNRLPDPANPPRITPSEMPKVRDALVRYFTSDLMASTTAAQAGSEPGGILLPGFCFDSDRFQLRFPLVSEWGVREFGRRKAAGLMTGELYWISAEFSELAVRAGKTMTDTSFAREDMPSPSGLIYFDAPILSKAVESDQHEEGTTLSREPIPLQAMSWTLVPGGIWVTVFSLTEAVYMGDPFMKERLGYLAPWSPGAGFEFGASDMSEAPASATLLAAWAIMQQERFASVTTVAARGPSKKVRKAVSEGRTAANSGVQVVDIRRRQRTATEAQAHAEARASGRKIDYQMQRTGHFKMQAWGPQWSLRKRIWVDPYWVGEAGAPVRFKGEKVQTLR